MAEQPQSSLRNTPVCREAGDGAGQGCALSVAGGSGPKRERGEQQHRAGALDPTPGKAIC